MRRGGAPSFWQNVDAGFDAVLAAPKGTAAAAIALLRDGGRLCSITSDAPAEERGIRTAYLYVRPEAGQLAHLASLAAGGRIELDRFVTTLDEGPSIAARVAAGQAGGTKYVLTP